MELGHDRTDVRTDSRH